MHTTCLISRHTLAHISRLSLKSQDFPPRPIWSDIIPLSVKDRSSAISPPLHPFHQPLLAVLDVAVVLIPTLRRSAVSTTTVAENITLKDSANGGGCSLGGCIIGVSGAGSLCVHALGLCMYVGGTVGGQCMHALMHSQLHTLMLRSVCASEMQSFHDRVRDCEFHSFLMKENDSNWSKMLRVDYLCTSCHGTP